MVTVALLSAASSGLKRSVLVNGGLSERSVSPGAPTEPEALGLKASAPQLVGVKALVLSETTPE